MKITWLGQAGLLFENEQTKIMLDPYLSNSVQKVEPKNYRRVAVDESFLKLKPDIMIFTHNHLDHYDRETAPHFIHQNSSVTVLCPTSVYNEVRSASGNNNFVLFNSGTTWTQNGISFTAVKVTSFF